MTPLIVILGLPGNVHHCTSHREGDWIIWRCPICAQYERRFNWRTGEMKCDKSDTGDIVHTGTNNAASNMEALTLNRSPN